MANLIASDLHGMGQLWDNIKNYLKPEDTLYFLGDAADRGPDGFRIMRELASHPQVVYLKGNHEMLLADAILEWYGDDNMRGAMQCLYENGGGITFSDWMQDGGKADWATYLRQLPSYVQLEGKDGRTVHLSHAGFSTNKPMPKPIELWWDRKHINDDYEDDTCWVIHGHTPTCYFYTDEEEVKEEMRNPAPILNGNKICIDLGSFATLKTCLFNLDTMKPIIIGMEGVIE